MGVAFKCAAVILIAALTGCSGMPEPVCGDGIVEGDEDCDDGNTVLGDGCSSHCEVEGYRSNPCGDGILDIGEACDDGNRIDDDACTNECTRAVCGNGIVQGGEGCDDGNRVDDDTCSNECVPSACGDGVVNPPVETCDDGNRTDGDFCTNACRPSACGDGIIGPGELCDDGNGGDTDACRNTCVTATCGDGVIWAGVEDCDAGPFGAGCPTCRTDDTVGDGVVDEGEECDDGNLDDTDACRNTLTRARCGDGVVWAGVELCDDGDDDDADECTTRCAPPTCGDGVVQAPELCDDGDVDDTDGCTSACVPAQCGDGHVQSGEECDDAVASLVDGCNDDCTLARCGDGRVLEGVEECDDDEGFCSELCERRCDPADWPGFADAVLGPGERCYLTSAGAETWEDARDACRAIGADLVSIETLEVNQLVRDQASAVSATETWTGLFRNPTGWHHSDAAPILFLRWSPIEPDGLVSDGEWCVAMDTNPDSPAYGRWSDEDCLTARSYTCEYAWPDPRGRER